MISKDLNVFQILVHVVTFEKHIFNKFKMTSKSRKDMYVRFFKEGIAKK